MLDIALLGKVVLTIVCLALNGMSWRMICVQHLSQPEYLHSSLQIVPLSCAAATYGSSTAGVERSLLQACCGLMMPQPVLSRH